MITINGRGADAAARQADERDEVVEMNIVLPLLIA